jgi:hypothetical protein
MTADSAMPGRGRICGTGANMQMSELRCQGLILELNAVNERLLKLIPERDALLSGRGNGVCRPA